VTLVWGALALGAIYAIVAIGYNVVFISSKTFNFAQAQLMMVGAFVAYSGLVSWNLPWLVVLLIAGAIVAVVAGIEERVAIRPVRDPHNILVTTLGVSILLDGAAQLIWGTEPLTVPFIGGSKAVTVIGGRVYPVELALIALAIVLVVGIELLSRRTKYGMALLAIAEDREASELRGINVRALALAAFVASGLLGGFVGLFVGPETFAVSTLGASLALKGFVALAIGGFGSFPGALVGGLVVGLVEIWSARFLGGDYVHLMIFGLLVLVLMVRPAGLFVRAKERSV
jgi:branched-chain amino acid transport system permease protein